VHIAGMLEDEDSQKLPISVMPDGQVQEVWACALCPTRDATNEPSTMKSVL
jgi:hypothetical protein